MVIMLVARGGLEAWPIARFEGYITPVLQPGLLDVIENAEPA